MKQILCVRLLNWSIDSLPRKSPGHDVHLLDQEKKNPRVVVRTAANRREVVAANSAATAAGIRSGMTLAQAQALCATLMHQEHDPARESGALASLARWMMRFSPRVCPRGDVQCIFLDVTGCQRVFGGLGPLRRQLSGAMRRWRLSARLAVAPSPGAAWALSHAGSSPEGPIVEQIADLPAALEFLPAAVLRLEEDCVLSLYHLGIETIGQLAKLPRSALPARFGAQLLLRLDQAMGRIAEPLIFMPYQGPVSAREDFDGAIDALESLWAVLEKLIDRVIEDLQKLGCGARRMEVDFFRPYAPPIHQTVLLSRPTRDGKKIFRLIQCGMEGIEPEARKHGGTKTPREENPVRKTRRVRGRSYCLLPPAGFTGIGIEAAVLERISDEQLQLLEQAERAGRIDLDDLLERLTLRLGPEGLLRPERVESHVPEKAIRTVPEANRMTGRTGRPLAKREVARMAPARPLWMLPMPIEIRVIAALLPDGDGRPASFVDRGITRRIVHVVGPERISGQWWEGRDKTRDYYDVEETTGQRFWIFRVAETARWFLQGEWG